MKKLGDSNHQSFAYLVISIAYLLYAGAFVLFHDRMETGISALAIFPVIAASWYLGVRGGIFTAVLSLLPHAVLVITNHQAHGHLFDHPDDFIGTAILIFIALLIGRLGTLTREHRLSIAHLERLEMERQSHTEFLECLDEITALSLEADSLDSTLTILLERIARLFGASESFFSLWDEAKKVPVPIAAYGSLSEMYPSMQFEPGDRTLTTSVLEEGRPIAVVDIENSPYVSPRLAAIFPSRSMLGLPLLVQKRRLGALLLGYERPHSFTPHDLLHADLASEQVALVLSKSLLLEEQRKQLKQLTTLHDIALISIEVDNEDELIRRVTDVIGQNLFPDNFGILLLDEQTGSLRVHPSYRFSITGEPRNTDVPLGAGITGQVAKTGRAQRLGNVHRVKQYLNVDDRTVSELCVPIKFKEGILGVINAESTKRDAFTEDDERLLITLAGQIATTMEQIRKAQAERKWLDQLAHSNDLIYALAQVTTHIEKAFSIDDIVRNLGLELSQLNLTCIMAVHHKESNLFTINYTSMEPRGREIIETTLGYPLLEYKFAPERLNAGSLNHPTVLSDAAAEIQMIFPRTHRQEASEILQEMGGGNRTELLRLPLVFEERLLGMLWLWGKGLSKADLPIMSIFAKQVGISLERARLFEEVQSLALTDPLTGLQNRRSLFELGKVEFARAHRMDRAFCCMMLDADHFKNINDTYGHLIGDRVLKEFAKRCKASVREVDLVGRYGGEELIILLPETDRGLALQAAERLRASIAATPIRIAEKEIPLTVSIGVAAKDEHTLHLETLIARADQAMYIAKHRGRNRVAISK